jgi:hypothetical protein
MRRQGTTLCDLLRKHDFDASTCADHRFFLDKERDAIVWVDDMIMRAIIFCNVKLNTKFCYIIQ